MLNRDEKELKRLAQKLSDDLNKNIIENGIVTSKAQVGGGTLPDLVIDSLAVKLISNDKSFAKRTFDKLLELDRPILGILREGNLIFDVQSIFEKDIEYIAEQVSLAVKG